VWDKFYENLQLLKKEGKANDENISMLFYHGYIEDVLKQIEEQDANQITPDFVIDELEKAAKLKEKMVEQEILKKEEEFFERLTQEISKKEQEKEAEWLTKIQDIKNNLKNSAQKKAEQQSRIYTSLLTILVVGLLYGLFSFCKLIGLDDFLVIIITLLSGGSGIVTLWIKFKKGILKKSFCRGPGIFPTLRLKIFSIRGQIYSPLCAFII
jgi:Fe2+ transport system protein B